MTAIFWAWGVSAALLLLLAVYLGSRTAAGSWLAILIDNRGRYSLTHFQLVVWTIVVLSLISGIFWGRLIDGVSEPLSFSIPDQVLGLLGISAGSAVTAGAVKATKDATVPEKIAVAAQPGLSQMFMVEEGANADKIIDVTKYQNFLITITLVVAYVALAIHVVHHASTAGAVTALPKFSDTFLVLLGISHAAYVAAKIPTKGGVPTDVGTLANPPT